MERLIKLVLLSAFVTLSNTAPDSYVNKGLDHDEGCGCSPDAAMATQYDTKIFVFAGFHFWFFDPFENANSMKATEKRIDEEFEGLSGRIDSAFHAFGKYYLIKGQRVWIYNHDFELVNRSSTVDWDNFPKNPDATQVIESKKGRLTLEVFVDDLVLTCDLDGSDSVSCPLDKSRTLNEDEKSVEKPIQAVATTSSGLQLIFGKDTYCLKLPKSDECVILCHPMIFRCKLSPTDTTIIVGIIIAMTVSVILVAVFFWENTISASSSGQVHGRRGV